MVICYTVSEILHVTDVICIFHFGYFLPFYPLNSLKNQNFLKNEKMKTTTTTTTTTTTGDIIILHLCTKNYDHMMYGS